MLVFVRLLRYIHSAYQCRQCLLVQALLISVAAQCVVTSTSVRGRWFDNQVYFGFTIITACKSSYKYFNNVPMRKRTIALVRLYSHTPNTNDCPSRTPRAPQPFSPCARLRVLVYYLITLSCPPPPPTPTPPKFFKSFKLIFFII